MFSLQGVASLTVIEAGGRGRPLHQRKIFAIVFGMALGALLAGSGIEPIGRVQTSMRVQSRRNFSVAFKAFESRLSAKLVAGSAVSRAFQCFMRLRKRARGNLCLCTYGECEQAEKEKNRHRREDASKAVSTTAAGFCTR